jgi:thioredoxin reductase (NADPH)
VPKTFINENLTSSGLEPEADFMESLLAGRQAGRAASRDEKGVTDCDLVILGAGPAGLTAAIYAERSGLRSIILERANVGGQVVITPVVENYPGFPKIAGKTLMDLMAQQAAGYATVIEGVTVNKVEKTRDGFRFDTSKGIYNSRGLILATGARHRRLDVPGEKSLYGRGVSYCATCDGYFYKDGKNVLVVGGGNSALTEALYLDSLGAHVTLLHHRNRFRGENRLQLSLSQRDIKILYSSRVMEILGNGLVEKVRVEDIRTGRSSLIKADAVFIAIGYEPNNEIAHSLGIETDNGGYITTDDTQRTTTPNVYAAGDVTGGVKQISVAVGQGSIAAISAFEDLGTKGR